MNEVLTDHKEKINTSNILEKLKLKKKAYFIVSIHREENVDNNNHLKQILSVLNRLAEQYSLPIVVSTHPRTKKRLEMLKEKNIDNRIQFLIPFGFFDYIKLQKESLCAISDSGTISEESAMLSFPAISLRQSMERPEAQDTGTIILTGFNPDIVLNAINTVIEEQKLGNYQEIPFEYQIKNTSWRVLKLIMGNAKLSNQWWGINSK